MIGFLPIIAIFAASMAVSYVMTQQAMKKAKKAAADMAGVLVNKESNIEPIPVIYGTRRVGGVRVFVSTRDVVGGARNEYLYIALVLCEGEVDSITSIHIDDVPITDQQFAGLVTINAHTGADDQLYDPLLTEANAGWTSSHRLQGVAYLAIRLKWNEDVFSGMPDITALVRGRKVYDPRTPLDDPAYSSNPALCIRDYLTNARFGKGLLSSSIDDDLFKAAATDCDESVTFYNNGISGKIFDCNAVLQTDEQLFGNIEKLLMGCRGFLPYSQGKYGLSIDKSGTSVFAFNLDNMIGGISIKGEQKEDKFNRVIVKFANPDVDYQPDEATWPDQGSTQESTLLAEDNGTLLVEELDLDTITNYYAARDLARVVLLRSRNSLRTSFRATSEALKLSVADIVTVQHPTPGWINPKPFQVENIQLNYDGTCDVALIEYDPSIYIYDLSAEQTSYPDTDLPNPNFVFPPTGLTTSSVTVINDDGTAVPAITVSFTYSADAFVANYEIQYKISSDTEFNSFFLATNTYTFNNAVVGATYDIRVRAVNAAGSKSEWVTASQATVGDITAPALPTSLSATAGQGSITLAWTNPEDKDFSNVEVHRSTSLSGTYSGIGSVSGGFGLPASFVNGSLLDSTTYFYKFKSVDYSGNKSEFTAEVSATTNDAALSPRADNGYVYYTESQPNTPSTPTATSYNYDTAAFAGLTTDWQKNPPTINGSDATLWASSFTITEASFGGSQTITFSVPFKSIQFDGLVTFTNLNAELGNASSTEITTINGGLLKTGTIEADRIRIDGVGIDVVTNGTEKTLQIGDNGVTTVKINNLAVTEGKIADLAVDTLKIADQAVTIPSGSTTTAPAYTEWPNGGIENINGSNYRVPVINSVPQWREISAITFTSAGGNVFLSFSGEMAAGIQEDDPDEPNGRTNIQFQILRDATVIQEGFVKGNYVTTYIASLTSLALNQMIDSFGNSISISALDNTTSGAHTWSLRVRPIVQEANFVDLIAANRNFSVSALEVKK